MDHFLKYSAAAGISLALLGLAGCASAGNEQQSSAPQSNVDTADKASQTEKAPSQPTEEQTSPVEIQTAEVHTAEVDTGSPAEWEPVVPQSSTLTENGAICGVAYIGFAEPDSDSAACREIFLGSEYGGEFDTLADIPKENFASSEGGTDLFLIIPADPDSTVAVYAWDFTEENDFIGEKGDAIMSGNGAPFLLKCNRSDIMPDTLVEITDSKGNSLSWSPCISLKDGTVSAADGVFDFTHYSQSIE